MPDTTNLTLTDQDFSIGPISYSCWKKIQERNEKGRFTGRCHCADLGKALNPTAVELAFGQGWITAWEREFCLDTQRKRNLSVKQKAKRKQINELVMARLAPVMEASATAEKIKGARSPPNAL